MSDVVVIFRKRERLDEDGEIERQCSKCEEWWPASAEFFYAAKGVLHAWCKVCILERNQEPTVKAQRVAANERWYEKRKRELAS